MLDLFYFDTIGKLSSDKINSYIMKQNAILDQIQNNADSICFSGFLGWKNVDDWAGSEALASLEQLAAEVRQTADTFVLVGVGGSNNAARAVIKGLPSDGKMSVLYGGNTLSPYDINKLLGELENKSFYINVIAKNFETLEPGSGFRILRHRMEALYGRDGAANRIICTGTRGSYFEELCRKEGYRFLTFPETIGGRYSALCDVGLFPMAVAGINIRQLVAGAKDMQNRLLTAKGTDNPALYYAAVRNLLYTAGYRIEMLAAFESRFRYFAKWWIQLFAESEGKDGKGLYPVFAEYSEDLHSVGQFVQEGTPVIFETFLEIRNQDACCVLSTDHVDDRFGYLDGTDFWDINKSAYEATVSAHSWILPGFRLRVDNLDAYHFGQLFYFFFFSCYLSAVLLGVNPFNQPGVEAYKQGMFTALGKR